MSSLFLFYFILSLFLASGPKAIQNLTALETAQVIKHLQNRCTVSHPSGCLKDHIHLEIVTKYLLKIHHKVMSLTGYQTLEMDQD